MRSGCLPVGREAVEGTPYDFRLARELGAQVMDAAYTDLEPRRAGRCDGTPERAGWQVRELWVDERYGFLEVFTGDSSARRGAAVVWRWSR